MRWIPIVGIVVLFSTASWLDAKEGIDLKEVLQDHEVKGAWIYDDADAGFAAAKASGKPVLVCFSCVP